MQAFYSLPNITATLRPLGNAQYWRFFLPLLRHYQLQSTRPNKRYVLIGEKSKGALYEPLNYYQEK